MEGPSKDAAQVMIWPWLADYNDLVNLNMTTNLQCLSVQTLIQNAAAFDSWADSQIP